MITLNVQQLLNEKGKTRYWLVKALDSNYETVNRLCDSASSAIYLETIEKLCRIFDCTPNDLLTIE
ncbi:MAG: helix-turn-helix transcriptional regulator [Peptococcaceae bacterium]|nr:helix-turn-helix transcriptional regulator [Peptococcaceae bacterium]